jgi:integrase
VQKFPKPFFRKPRRRWYVEIRGKQVNLGPDRDEAYRLYHEMMGDATKPITTPAAVQGKTIVALIDAFLGWCQKHKAARTYDWYVEKTTSFARTLADGLTIDELKPFHVQEWVDAHDEWAPGQKRGCITAIQRVFNWAVKQGRLDRSPIRGMEKPEQGQRDTVVSSELFQKVILAARSLDFRDLLIVCWETGCRPQEVTRVEPRHVDLAQSRWVFPPSEAKGKKRTRYVYLTPASLEITRRRMAEILDGPLFRNQDGEPWRPQAIACAFQRVQVVLGREELERRRYKVEEHAVQQLAAELRQRGRDRRKGKRLSDKELLGVARTRLLNQAAAKHGPKLCLYNLRHSWATRALETGVDGVTVSVLMGHADTRMLCRVYQHLSQNPQNLREAMCKATGKTS